MEGFPAFERNIKAERRLQATKTTEKGVMPIDYGQNRKEKDLPNRMSVAFNGMEIAFRLIRLPRVQVELDLPRSQGWFSRRKKWHSSSDRHR